MKKSLIISGSYKRNGNTATLIDWFREGAKEAEVVRAADLKPKIIGCSSCRKCQSLKEFKCVINDDVSRVLQKMIEADVIVFATPLYFFMASAPITMIVDRMFSLYHWDNDDDTFESPLKGKTLVLLASAYEDVGLDVLAKPFKLTANYTGMKFKSLLVPNAGVSGTLKSPKVRKEAVKLGKALS